ncbi:class I SAM-dependent methyltransferase [Amycolatopsis sp. NPDC051071]|uniref:class I SAM-dependent methyltransferase n=1 Tax=Amycolatopsis sp. NPDC051071 TaxID=3154637 RepID=UPI003448AAD4
MATTSPTFTPAEASLFLTLCGRALDSRQEHSILHDTTASEIVERTGTNTADYPHAKTGMRDIALRAKKLDGVVRDFIAVHPNSVVVDLGAGLDSRMIRVDPPSTVDWYDVDLPKVIAARRKLLPQPANAHFVAADVADLSWIDELPTDRPAVIVADGLVAFLAQPALTAALRGLTAHFPEGEIAFNGYTRFHVWALKHYKGTNSIADAVANPGFDDPHAPERWNPDLTLVEEILLSRAPEVAGYPLFMRLATRLAALSTAWSRRGTTVVRYRFAREG